MNTGSLGPLRVGIPNPTLYSETGMTNRTALRSDRVRQASASSRSRSSGLATRWLAWFVSVTGLRLVRAEHSVWSLNLPGAGEATREVPYEIRENKQRLEVVIEGMHCIDQ